MVIDFLLLGYLLLGIVLGYINAGLKAFIKSVSLLLPLLVIAYFIDDAILLGQEILSFVLSKEKQALGFWGGFAAFIGAGSAVLLIRLLVGLGAVALPKRNPKTAERIGGALIGLATNFFLILVLLQSALFLLPVTTKNMLAPTASAGLFLPISEYFQPAFDDIMSLRMARVAEAFLTSPLLLKQGAGAQQNAKSLLSGEDIQGYIRQIDALPQADKAVLFERLKNIDLEQLRAVLDEGIR